MIKHHVINCELNDSYNHIDASTTPVFTYGQRHSDNSPELFGRLSYRKLIVLARNPRDLTGISCSGEIGTRALKAQCMWFIPSDCKVKTKAEMMQHGQYCLLVADLDHGNSDPQMVAEVLTELDVRSFVIYDTVSSSPGNRRLRVVIPLSEPVGVSVWADLQNALTFALDGDDCTTRSQQISYLPTLSQCNQTCYEAVIHRGTALDPIASPFAKQAQAQALSAAEQLASERKVEQSGHTVPSPEPIGQNEPGHINPFQLFNQVNDWNCLLRSCGFKKASGGRWVAPCSASGVPGVIITTRYRPEGAYLSSHNSDPLCYQYSTTGKQLHDKFDVWMVHGLGLDHNNPAHRSQAIKYFAENYVLDRGITLQRHNQRIFMANQRTCTAIK